MKIKLVLLCIVFSGCLVNRPATAQDYVLDKKDTSEVRYINKKKFFIYKVEKGETLYSLTKKFGVTEAELLEFNPELKDGLKNKMKLWIPAAGAMVMPATPVEVIPEEKPKGAPLEFALFLPLHIDKQSVSGELLNDSLLLGESLIKETAASLEFYEGLLYALHIDAAREKLKVNLHVYDTQEDTSVTSKLLRNVSMEKMDLIFVSAGTAVLKQVNQFSKLKSLPVASVSMSSGDIFKDNPSAIVVLPSSLMQCKKMGMAAAALNKGAHCLVIRSSNPKEVERSKAFQAGWLEESKDGTVRELVPEKNLAAVADSLSASRHNVVFVPSSNEDFVSSLLTALEQVPADKKFTLVGIPTWQYFETIHPALMEKLNTFLFSTSSIDYEGEEAGLFRKHCRETYGNEPSDQSYQGFDVMRMITSAWKGGKDLPERLRKDEYQGLYTRYRFVTSGACTENDFIYVLRYKDYNLEKVDVPK